MNDMSETLQASTGVKAWPILGEAADVARIMGGTWTRLPQSPISTIRHRLDTIEEDLSGFLYAPELFSIPNGTKAHLALPESPQAVAKGAAGLLVTRRPRNLDPDFPCLIVDNPALPKLMGPSPNNPQGAAVLVLGDGTCGIHGTNRDETISTAASCGCFRMHNADVLALFEKVEIGTRVYMQ